MKVYAGIAAETPISQVVGYAQRIEGLGYDGLTRSIGINPPADPAEDGAVAEIIRALQAG